MKMNTTAPMQPATIHDLDTVMLRHARWEAVGILLLAGAVVLAWILVAGFSFRVLAVSLGSASVLVLVVIGLSFIIKEPAIETIAKVVWVRATHRTEARTEKATEPELAVASTSVADEDFHTALSILDASLRAHSKEKDGEKMKGRAWTFRRCKDAKLIPDNWAYWSRIMSLWERSGIVAPNREGTLQVAGLREGETKLKGLYESEGYVLFNRTWMKR